MPNARALIGNHERNVGTGILSLAALGVAVLIKGWIDSTNQKS
jgi:hypothetical protein